MGPGTQVGAYRLVRRIGQGGMGAVWLAEHSILGRQAAIKVLHASFSMQPDIVTRFFNEARATTAIADPGIVQVFDFGHHSDGSAYIVMELLEGETLGHRLKERGTLAVAEALRLVRQVAGSLGAAHARGIVHRDLKPENIFIVRDIEVPGGERAKILDFGIAKLVGGGGEQTHASLVIGTPQYMSPEQCRGAGHVDQRSDVYSLGCVLFALLTGRPPFTADGGGDLIVLHLMVDPPRAAQFAPDIPDAVEDLLTVCLAKDAARRFDSGAALANRIGVLLGLLAPSDVGTLGRAATPLPVRATPMPVEETGAPVHAPTPAPLDDSPRRAAALAAVRPGTTLGAAAGVTEGPAAAARRSPIWVIGAVAGLGVAAGGIALAFVVGSREAAKPPRVQDPPISVPTAVPAPVAAAAPVAVVSPPSPAPPPPAPPPSPDAAVAELMKDVLGRFPGWAQHHAGAPCPTLAALGVTGLDPWQHALELTCVHQPEDQQIGAISAGPDGKLDTKDDIKSWRLHELDDIVSGPRWVAHAHAVRPPPTTAIDPVTGLPTLTIHTSGHP